MTHSHKITALGLCLFLTLSSVGLAVARGAPQPAGQMVLCTGTGVEVVLVDGQGRPMTPPHVCPDCLLGFCATALREPLPAATDAYVTARHPVAQARHITPPAQPSLKARAPPRPV